jgi:hypothetical protein
VVSKKPSKGLLVLPQKVAAREVLRRTFHDVLGFSTRWGTEPAPTGQRFSFSAM